MRYAIVYVVAIVIICTGCDKARMEAGKKMSDDLSAKCTAAGGVPKMEIRLAENTYYAEYTGCEFPCDFRQYPAAKPATAEKQ